MHNITLRLIFSSFVVNRVRNLFNQVHHIALKFTHSDDTADWTIKKRNFYMQDSLVKNNCCIECSNAGTGGGGGGVREATAPFPYLADQLTLFHPGEGRLFLPISNEPQVFSPSGITGMGSKNHSFI